MRLRYYMKNMCQYWYVGEKSMSVGLYEFYEKEHDNISWKQMHHFLNSELKYEKLERF